MSKIKSLLDRLYEKNPETGRFIIEVAAKNYDEIFNHWDNDDIPFKKKDINPGLLGFLKDSIDDIPPKYGIEIVFSLSNENKNEKRERIVAHWFETFYSFYIEVEKSKTRRIVISSVLFAVLSVSILALSYFSNLLKDTVTTYMLKEIITVGGWLFLWQALSQLIFDVSGKRKLIRGFNRLAKAPVSFRYKKKSENSGS